MSAPTMIVIQSAQRACESNPAFERQKQKLVKFKYLIEESELDLDKNSALSLDQKPHYNFQQLKQPK